MHFYCIKLSKYFPKQCESFGADINVKVDLSNYATKTNFKNATRIDTSKLVAKCNLVSLKAEDDKLDIDELISVPTNLSNLKSKVDKLDIEKIKTTPVDLSKLGNVVKNNAVKKTEYSTNIKNIEDKLPDVTSFTTKTTHNAKINEVKAEIPSTNNLVTTSALIAVGNKIPDVSNLV